MKIKQIKVKNYRLLKDFSIDLEDNLSLIIGKNNTGKTSLLHILHKFLCTTSNTFNFEDFSISFQCEIINIIENKTDLEQKDYNDLKLELNIFIEYNDKDNLRNLSDFILDLDPENKTIFLSFEYSLNYDNYTNLKNDYKNYHLNEKVKLIDFLKKYHKKYFSIQRKVIDLLNKNNFIEIEDSKIQKIINIQTISANRDVVNEDGDSAKCNKTLSKQSYKYYKPFENSQASHVIELQKKLIETDIALNTSYKEIFKKVTDDIEKFSYDGSKLSVKSNFQEVNLLRENTSVGYDEDGYHLPEDYNGLGYLNLFSMIFALHIIFDKFKKTHLDLEPSDINLLLIEEPEAHTHPQMQYVFIKNIKQFLNENKDVLNLQTIITTHSAHITSQSEFNDIKYFLNKEGDVTAKNLSNLENQYDNADKGKANFKFLKQYLTLSSAELFFSDKIIFIEGDTERILLPAMMKKLDIENKNIDGYVPILSQKISIIEVGAYSKVFDKFLEFLEIQTLIITDIDSVDGNKIACKVDEGNNTSNCSIKYFLSSKNWNEIKNLDESERIITSRNAPIYIAYQTNEKGYHGRSFEDSFISLNSEFIKNNKDNFTSIKNKNEFENETLDYFNIANKCINKKTEFATDILFYSSEDFSNWEIPEYIRKGLLWLK